MAWCPHCKQDRPIQRQLLAEAKCQYCYQPKSLPHHEDCRGPVPGTFDVCTFCNTSLFALAPDEARYTELLEIESKIPKPPCFVVTATMGSADHRVVTELRSFRDDTLINYRLGRALTTSYYKHGPRAAKRIENDPLLRSLSWIFLVGPAYVVVRTGSSVKNFLCTNPKVPEASL